MWENSLVQRIFTPNGKYLVSLDVYNGIYIHPFDRCTGFLGELIDFPKVDTWHSSIVFSPNSRFLYLSRPNEVLQFDLHDGKWNNDTTVAIYDGFVDEHTGISTIPVLSELGPDGKIYGFPPNTYYVHYVAKPNIKGLSCKVIQHAFKTPTLTPYGAIYPNYRLGPIDGSPCDTLGINNEPLADFWWIPDSTLTVEFTDNSSYEPAIWQWDFGDGFGMSADTNPVYTFPAAGMYKVCLTVSNQYAADSICKFVPVGVTSIAGNLPEEKAAIQIIPNPTRDHFQLQYRWPHPNGRTALYDATGRLIQVWRLPEQEGTIRFDVRNLAAGMYFLNIESPGKGAVWEKVIVTR